MTVSVYAITNSTRVPRFPGRRGEPLRGVRVGRLTAVVGEARRAPSSTPASLRRYHDVIEGLAGRLPAVLPARFGTLMTEEELSVILRSRAATLSRALKHVRGRVQMTLRGIQMTAHGGGASAPPAALPAPAGASGAEYLRGRAAHAARERDVPELAAVRAAVARWIRDEEVERRGGVVSVYHLIPRGSAAAYARAAHTAASAAGVRVVISGPYPPYAFATL